VGEAPTRICVPSSPISFFTRSVDPSNTDYSWNRSWPDSKSAFLSGKLATYFGLASEISDIRAKNPNLNFDVTYFPQFQSSQVQSTLGRIYGAAVLKTSPNPSNALAAALALASQDSVNTWVSLTNLPPVRKDVGVPSSDPFMAVFRNSAVIAKGWLDPNRLFTGPTFKEMSDSSVAGQMKIHDAISRAAGELMYNQIKY